MGEARASSAAHSCLEIGKEPALEPDLKCWPADESCVSSHIHDRDRLAELTDHSNIARVLRAELGLQLGVVVSVAADLEDMTDILKRSCPIEQRNIAVERVLMTGPSIRIPSTGAIVSSRVTQSHRRMRRHINQARDRSRSPISCVPEPATRRRRPLDR